MFVFFTGGELEGPSFLWFIPKFEEVTPNDI